MNTVVKIQTAIPIGYFGTNIYVEGSLTRGLPCLNIIGMANKTILESKERIRSAITSSGFIFPNNKLTINLAPAEIQKDGTATDLPIALVILILSKQLTSLNIKDKFFIGELSLDGEIKPVRGIINIIETAINSGYQEIFIPYKNLDQAHFFKDVKIFGVKNLYSLFLHLKDQKLLPSHRQYPYSVKNTKTEEQHFSIDNISGQDLAKRALQIAIAGRHNLLMSGPPGTGKTTLAKIAHTLLPKPNHLELLEITKIHNLVTSHVDIPTTRPIRSPHHTSSVAALIGGGTHITPGEISLAHNGILFLDELPEFSRHCLESLRQPLEDRTVTISRVNEKYTFPADFLLIATMNPCPCGYLHDKTKNCTCTASQINSYSKKISGPLLDRFDLKITLKGKQDNSAILSASKQKTTNAPSLEAAIKNHIKLATNLQAERFGNRFYNGTAPHSIILKKLDILPSSKQLLDSASKKFNLSARSYIKILRVARTIADLDKSQKIKDHHISEALSYRTL